MFNDKINGAVELFDRSDGKAFYAQFAQPFFEASSSRSSGSVTFDDRLDRILQYRGGAT